MAHETLPHSTRAEMALMGAILVGGREIYQDARQLEVRDWYHDVHQWAWACMVGLVQRGSEIDPILLEEALRASGHEKRIGHWAECMAMCPSMFLAGHYARIVKDMSERRQQIARAGKMAGEAWEGRIGRPKAVYEE